MRTPLTYYGGKQQLASRILSMVPKHKIYCEPFFGGGAVFFAKPKSYLEVINDTNDRLITFYQQAQNNYVELKRMIQSTLTSERMYYEAKDIYNNRTEAYENISSTDYDLLIAWSVWMITNGSFSASMHGAGSGATDRQEAIREYSCATNVMSSMNSSMLVLAMCKYPAATHSMSSVSATRRIHFFTSTLPTPGIHKDTIMATHLPTCIIS